MDCIIVIGHINDNLIAVGIEFAFDRQCGEHLGLVVGNLLSVHREGLSEVAIAIEEAHGAEVDVGVAGFLHIVAGQNAKTA